MKILRLWGKLLVSYILAHKLVFLAAFIVSLSFIFFYPQLSLIISPPKPKTIGLVGNFTASSLPREIQEKISFGLVKLLPDGTATVGAATSWQATDSGRVFSFELNPDLFWQDGKNLDASQINYNFKGVEIERLDNTHIKFILKEPFSPLLALLSQPLFKNGLVGLGENKVVSVGFNGRFLGSLTLQNQKSLEKTIYKFYSSEKDLLNALRIGAVRQITGLYEPIGLSRNYLVTETLDPSVVVTIFFNTQKTPFDDKPFRQGLTYALPDNFDQGKAAEAPIPLGHWAQTIQAKKYPQNLEAAKNLVIRYATGSSELKIVISANPKLKDVAEIVSVAWNQIGLKTKVSEVDFPPADFDAYLTYLPLPVDPDQYALWHSTQTGNISHYKSFKVDKLLEEGRQTTNKDLRQEIYANFQKAITEDAPAAFLFYPKVYDVTRK